MCDSALKLFHSCCSGEIGWFVSQPVLPTTTVRLFQNQLSGILPPLARGTKITLLDVRFNLLQCPYPVFPISPAMIVFRSPCISNWVQTGTYIGVASGIAFFGVLVFLCGKRAMSHESLLTLTHFIGWGVCVVVLAGDMLSYTSILQYLHASSQNCDALNAFRVFKGEMSISMPASLRTVAPDTPFAVWIASPEWSALPEPLLSQTLQFNTYHFSEYCGNIMAAPECAYDSARGVCFEAIPDLAISGPSPYKHLIPIVAVTVAIRAAIELVGLVLVVVCLLRNTVLADYQLLFRQSVFMPLLLVRSTTRSLLASNVVMVEFHSPLYHVGKLFVFGLLVNLPQLAITTYFAINVSQVGLVWYNWLSLCSGVILVPKLLGQAVWSWWMLLQDSLEQHYEDRAASGADLDVDQMCDTSGLPPLDTAAAEMSMLPATIVTSV
jgi:hypothetical protein